MNRLRNITLLLLALTAMAGCRRVAPQSPANRQDDDTTGLAVSMMNMRLAEAADRQLTQWVQQADTAYTLDEYGYWYCIYRHTDGQPIQEHDRVEVFFRTSRLDGTLIEDSQLTLTVGRRETLWAIDVILPTLHDGEAVRIVSPYYTAYGREGNETVEPLTNCIIDITDARLVR